MLQENLEELKKELKEKKEQEENMIEELVGKLEERLASIPEDIEELVKTNMLLFGGVIVFLSFLRTMIDYWLKISYPEDKENPPLPSERE